MKLPTASAPLKALSDLPLPAVIAIVAGGLALMGWVDYVTGIEVRVLPLYYLPLSLAAWTLRRRGAVITAIAGALIWLAANYLAGRRYSADSIATINFVMQAASFIIVGLLIANVRQSYFEATELGRIDALTRLLNARAFADEAGRVLAIGRRYHHAITLAYLDLDNFKHLNDTRGHGRGDDALRATADVLRTSVRAGDVLARIGGDEFVVLLPETGPQGAGPIVERLRSSLLAALKTHGDTLSVSVGVISFSEPPESVDVLLRGADELMYAAKLAGKNQVRLAVASEG